YHTYECIVCQAQNWRAVSPGLSAFGSCTSIGRVPPTNGSLRRRKHRWYSSLPSRWKGDDIGDHWLFEALLLCGLLWLSLLLDWMCPRERLAPCQTTPTPARPIKRRSKDPKPFPGLTHTPHCDACAHGPKPAPQAPPCLPPLPASPCGRRREVDTQ